MAVKYFLKYWDVSKNPGTLTDANLSILGSSTGAGYEIGDIVNLRQTGVTDEATIEVTGTQFGTIIDFVITYGGSGYTSGYAYGETPNDSPIQTIFTIANITDGIEHGLTIDVPDYEGDAVQIGGKVILNNSDTDSNLEAIRGQALTVELEADVNLTFSDLWSEDEKTVKVEYFREPNVIPVPVFSGFLNPEGFFENWVSTNWVVSFDCIDGLGYLSELSYVDENGLPITGYKSQIETLAIALKRTGIENNILTSIDIRYIGLSDDEDPLANVYVNSERYIKDDGATIMDCDAVIRDILEPYGAVLTYTYGVWVIYKPNQLYLSQKPEFFRYDYKGDVIPGKGKNNNFIVNIGSDFYNPIDNGSNSFLVGPLIHCNEDQKMSNVSSLGAYRVSYTYGLVDGLLTNPSMTNVNGTVNGWSIIDPGNLGDITTPVPNKDFGFKMRATNGDRTQFVRSTEAQLEIDTVLTAQYSPAITPPDSGVANYFIFRATVRDLDSPGNIYTYSDQDANSDNWGWFLNDPDKFSIRGGFSYSIDSSFITKIQLPPLPVAGFVYVDVLRPSGNFNTQFGYILSFDFLPTNVDGAIGEFHTVQRTSKPSAKVHKVQEVATGDNPTDIYEGTMLKNDIETPTEFWTRKGMNENKPLLQITGEEQLRMNAKAGRIFSGSVYGFFPYLSVISIHGLDGLFMPIKYSYDTVNNIVSGEFKQLFGDELDDIDYTFALNTNGNVVTPTIK